MQSNNPSALAGTFDSNALGRVIAIVAFSQIPPARLQRLAERVKARKQAAATVCADQNLVKE